MGKRQVSMADVARAAGVSQQTVSRVVNNQACVSEATRQRIQDAMDELGFRPNFAGRSLRGGSYRCIGLALFNLELTGNAATLAGIASAARECGFATTLIELDGTHPVRLADVARQLAELPVDGMVINVNRNVSDFESFTPAYGLPTVIISMREHPRCTTIDLDQYGCSKLVVEHLAERGHTHIRHIAGPIESITSHYRLGGWRDALVRRGLEPSEAPVGDWGADSGYELGARLAADLEMDALYAANDQMAMGAIQALRDAGRRVPEDVSVVGVDDSVRNMIPNNQLTTVRFDQHESGRIIFEQVTGSIGRAVAAVADNAGPTGGELSDAREAGAAQDGAGTKEADGPKAIRLPGELIERATVARRN